MSAPMVKSQAARSRKMWVLGLCMLAVAVFSAVFKPRPVADAQARTAVPLESLFPTAFGDWRQNLAGAVLIRPAFEQARQFQMYDQVLERSYVNAQGQVVMLSVAYGRQQSVGLQMHRPEVCYKAGGFEVGDVSEAVLRLAGRDMPITHMVARLPGRPEPVMYWRLLGDTPVANEAQFKLRQLRLGVSGGIPDGLLVRISSIDEDVPAMQQLHAAFAQAMVQAMTPAQQQRVLGALPTP